MILSVKKRSTRYMNDKAHAAYGIQNYLLKKKFIPHCKTTPYKVQPEAYADLLKEFCNQHPKWEAWKKKSNIETFVNLYFPDFAKFCNKKFKPKANES